MQEQPEVKRFYGLKVARTIFRILYVLGVIVSAVLIFSGIVSAVRDPQFNLLPVAGNVVEVLFRTLLFYAAYQLIDVVLSINDHLRRLTTSPRADQPATPIPARSRRTVTAVLEQHHRRLEKLEKGQGSN